MPRPGATKDRDPHDDLPEELPPLDGDGTGRDDEEHEEGASDEDLDPSLAHDLPGADPFDDATGERDPVGEEWLDPSARDDDRAADGDAEPDDSLDVGEDASTLGPLDGPGWLEVGAADEMETPDEDHDFVEGESFGADAGEEGPVDADEGIREEDLPSLDADDGGEGEDTHFFDSLAAEDAPLPWSKDRFAPTPVVSHLGIGRVVGIVPVPLGATCLGDRLWRVEVDGAIVALPASGLPDAPANEARTIMRAGSALFVASGESVYRSDDGGESFAATDAAPHDDAARSFAAAQDAIKLPRGFELAAATHDGPTLFAVVRSLMYGRLYVVRVEAEGTTSASPAVVAEIAEPEDAENYGDDGAGADGPGDADRLTTAWDRERGILWVGGPFGVFALANGR